jgi:glucose/arabinose dehydrogenase
MLYLAIGEAAVRSDAQKLSTYNGKVLPHQRDERVEPRPATIRSSPRPARCR